MSSRLTFNEAQHSYWLADPLTGRKARVPSVSSLKNTLYQFGGERWYIQQAAEALSGNWDAIVETAPPLRGKRWNGQRQSALPTRAISGAPCITTASTYGPGRHRTCQRNTPGTFNR